MTQMYPGSVEMESRSIIVIKSNGMRPLGFGIKRYLMGHPKCSRRMSREFRRVDVIGGHPGQARAGQGRPGQLVSLKPPQGSPLRHAGHVVSRDCSRFTPNLLDAAWPLLHVSSATDLDFDQPVSCQGVSQPLIPLRPQTSDLRPPTSHITHHTTAQDSPSHILSGLRQIYAQST